jgi:hypothetical protein
MEMISQRRVAGTAAKPVVSQLVCGDVGSPFDPCCRLAGHRGMFPPNRERGFREPRPFRGTDTGCRREFSAQLSPEEQAHF